MAFFSHHHENLKFYTALTGWALSRDMFPVKHKLDSYITEDDILYSHCRENLKPYVALTGCAL
jgi:hypothetical protein